MRPKLLAEEPVEEEQSIKRSDYLSDNEQRVTKESALLGDLFWKYVSYCSHTDVWACCQSLQKWSVHEYISEYRRIQGPLDVRHVYLGGCVFVRYIV